MAAKHAAAVARSNDTHLALVIDRDRTRAAALAEQYGAAAHTSIDAALTCDAAIVASSTPNHREDALPLIASGLPVLVEKPIGASMLEVIEILAASDDIDGVLMCGFVERFNPALAAFAGLAGRRISAVTTQRVGPPPTRTHSSVVDDVLLHDLDLVLRLVDDQAPVTVRLHAHDWPAGAPWPESASVDLTFAGGATASLRASRAATTRVRTIGVRAGSTTRSADLLAAPGDPLRAQLAHLLDLTRYGTPSERAAERAGILPAHELADRIGSEIGSACVQ